MAGLEAADKLSIITGYKYSFFELPQNDSIKSHIRCMCYDYTEEEDFTQWRGNQVTATLLHQGKYEKAENLINKMVEKYPNNIQAWIMKGRYLLDKPEPDLEGVREVESTLSILLESPDAVRQAKHLYAYWLSFHSNKCVELMNQVKSIYEEIIGQEESNEMKALYSYFYMKALYRHVGSLLSAKQTREAEAVIIQVMTYLIFLAKHGNSQSYELKAAIWFAEFKQIKLFSNRCKNMYEIQLQRFKSETNVAYAATMESCLRWILELANDELGHNTLGRAGRLMLRHAQTLKLKGDRLFWLGEAFRMVGVYERVRRTHAAFLPTTCATISLEQWAVHYYSENESIVASSYRECKGKGADEDDLWIWKHAAMDMYCSQNQLGHTQDSTLMEFLSEAKRHLIKERQQNGRSPLQLPRVMSLLGEPAEDVEEEFNSAFNGSLDNKGEMTRHSKYVLEHRGRFYETIGRPKEAREDYAKAIAGALRLTDVKAHMACHRLKRIGH